MSAQLLDAKGRPIVAVTGFGIVTSLGQGKADNWAALSNGVSGIHDITRFSTEGLRTTICGSVDFFDFEQHSAPALSQKLAQVSMDEAIEQAAIGAKGDFPGPLFIAVPPSEVEWFARERLFAQRPADAQTCYDGMLRAIPNGDNSDLHSLFKFAHVADQLADRYGTKGQPISLSTACASGATAIQLGVEAIRRGETEAAVCVGTDGSIYPESLIRFSLLSALSTQNDPPEKAAKPFSKNRDGFVMAEGSAAFVLESYAAAKARGATILGIMRGCGERADNFHRTRSSPDGTPIILALQDVLDDADLSTEQIDYINAHGTSTPENDKMEYLSLKAVFGDRLPKVPISSNKSMIGHTLTAAGAIEAAFSMMTIATGTLPPTINYDIPDPDIDLDVVPHTKRDMPVSAVLSNSFGFGGQNVCLIMTAPD